ncbi:hypothetical protein ACLK1Y_05960 [Escherichia coli]
MAQVSKASAVQATDYRIFVNTSGGWQVTRLVWDNTPTVTLDTTSTPTSLQFDGLTVNVKRLTQLMAQQWAIASS